MRPNITPEEILEEMKESTILSIQDFDKMQPIDHGGWKEVDAPLSEYDRIYPQRLKESLGTQLKIARSNELIREIKEVERKEAERIADMWIAEAEKVKNVTRQDIIRSAELYLAYRELMSRYQADAITMSSWALVPDGRIKAMPPLAEMEFAKSLIPSCCENLIDSTLTQMIGTRLSGRPGFVGDVLNSWGGLSPIATPPKNLVIVGHCYGPINPHGNDRVPYVIRDHVVYGGSPSEGWMKTWRPDSQVRAARQLEKEHITLVGITVRWPAGEVASIVKFNVYERKASVYTGRTVDGNSIYDEFDEKLCRTKIAVETDAPFMNVIGGHHVVFYGDLKEQVHSVAEHLGFEVVSDHGGE